MQDENQGAQKRSQESEQEFSKPWNQSDVVLIVEGQNFHVHRLILTMISPVFSQMFSSESKKKDADKIPLPEKKAAEIREMLMVIYPIFNKPVNDTNLYFLLPLAQEYQMTVLTHRCEDHLLRLTGKKRKIGPILETLIVAQNYTLERVIAECINKTARLTIEELQGHELYEQVEPRSQRKMIELQVGSMQRELREAKAEILKLKNRIREMGASASNGLRSFESLVATLGRHIRHAKKEKCSFTFSFTKEQNLETIRSDNDRGGHLASREAVCSYLCSAYSDLEGLQGNLNAIKSNTEFTLGENYGGL